MVTDDGPSSQGIVIVSLDVLSLFFWIENGTLRENFLLPPFTRTLLHWSKPRFEPRPARQSFCLSRAMWKESENMWELAGWSTESDLGKNAISFSALYTKWILFRRLSKREAGNWRKKQTKKEYTLKNHYVHSRLKQERHEVDRTQTWRWLKNLLLKQKLCQWMYFFKCLNLSSKASSPEVSYPSFSRTSTEFHWVKFTELHDNAITNNSILFRRNLSTFNPNLGKLFSSIYSRLSPLKMFGGLSC